jgi:hypothetical protein
MARTLSAGSGWQSDTTSSVPSNPWALKRRVEAVGRELLERVGQDVDEAHGEDDHRRTPGWRRDPARAVARRNIRIFAVQSPSSAHATYDSQAQSLRAETRMARDSVIIAGLPADWTDRCAYNNN